MLIFTKVIEVLTTSGKENSSFSNYEYLWYQTEQFMSDKRHLTAEEKNLLNEELTWETIFKSSTEGILVTNRQGLILKANAVSEKIFGYRKGELLHIPIESLIPVDLRERHTRHRTQYHQSPHPRRMGQGMDLRGLRKDGSEFDVEVSLSPASIGETQVVTAFVVDITERKKTTEASLRLSAIVNSTDEAIIGKNNDGIVTSWNHGAEKIYGYPVSEVINQTVAFLIPPDRHQEITFFAETIESGRSIDHFETKRIKKNGDIIDVSITISPIKDDTGKLIGSSAIARDITRHKKDERFNSGQRKILEMMARQAPLPQVLYAIVKLIEGQSPSLLTALLLLNSEKTTLHTGAAPSIPDDYNKAIDGIAIGPTVGSCGSAAFWKEEVVVADILKDPLWTDYKQLALKFGLKACWSTPIISTEDDVLGTFSIYFKETRGPDESERALVKIATHLAAIAIEQHKTVEALRKSEVQLRQYAGELEGKVKERTRELSATVKKLVETNLNLEYQVRETRAAEAQARESHALYATIAKHFPHGMIAVIDREYTMVFLEGEELQKIKLDKQAVEGVKVGDVKIFNAEWKMHLLENARKTFQGNSLSYNTTLRGYSYQVNTMPLYVGQNQVALVLFVFNNITEQKKTELEMLRALKKEKDLGELKSRFVSLASHEFRTPLSTILSSANLIAWQNEPGLENKRLKNVARIKSNVKSLVDILDEFLSIGKLDEGKVSVKPEWFDLTGFINSILQELQHAKKEGQKVILHSSQNPVEVNLDKQHIKNIFLNLLSNAFKYSPEGSPVEITIEAVETTLTVSVRDHGMGIPEDEQKELFERFFRSRHASHIQGTGLGLYIVKKYVELLHGEISFVSTFQKGSNFTIVLPLDYHDRYEKDFIN